MEVSQFPSGQTENIRPYGGLLDINMTGNVPARTTTMSAFGNDVDDVLDENEAFGKAVDDVNILDENEVFGENVGGALDENESLGKDIDDVLDGNDDDIRVCCSSLICTCRVDGAITKFNEDTDKVPSVDNVASPAAICEATVEELDDMLVHETPEKYLIKSNVENAIEHIDAINNTLAHVSKTFPEYFVNESQTITNQLEDKSLIELKMTELGGCRRKARKRKQSKPKSLCKEEDLKFLADIDASGDVFDEFDDVQHQHVYTSYIHSHSSIEPYGETPPKQIKHKPLCSQLCTSRKRKHKRSKRRPSASSEKLISDIIVKALENKSAQHDTNRYRRHFLKQKHKAEEKHKRVLEAEHLGVDKEHSGKKRECFDENKQHWDEKKENLGEKKEHATERKEQWDEKDEELNKNGNSIDLTGEVDDGSSAVNYSKDVGSDSDGVIECKPIRMNLSLEGTLECCICSSTFDDIGSLTAHYMCHNSLDQEHTKSKPDDSDGGPSDVPPEGHTVQNNPFPSFDMLGHSPNSDSRSGERKKDCSWGLRNSTNDSDTRPDLNAMETGTYFCHICNQKFSDIITLQKHVTEHSMDAAKSPDSAREFFCYLCQKKFASAGSLHVHNKIHTGDNPYTCLTCQKTFRDKTRLTTHIRVHTGEKPYLCHICNKAFSQKGNLKLHQKIHTGERDSVCHTCGNTFRSKGDLLRHMKIHGQGESSDSSDTSSKQKKLYTEEGVGGKDDDCPVDVSLNKFKDANDEKDCSSSQNIYQQAPIDFHAFFSMNKHKLEKPTGDNPEEDRSSDGKVGRVFKQEEKDLLVSIDTEVEFIKAMTNAKVLAENSLTVPRSYMCPLCGLALTSFEAFNHHLLSSHNPHSMFSMPLGSLALNVSLPPELSAVHAHSPLLFPSLRADDNLAGSVKKSYKCQECRQEFSSLPKFQIHMRSHADHVSAHLTDHVKDHVKDHVTEGGTEECGICSKHVTSDELQEHLKAHSEEKTYTVNFCYSCDFCCKTFRRSHHLQTHLRTHTGARPYTCTDCGKNFARGDHLQNHKRTHTGKAGEKPYTCEICHKSYSQSHHLLRHKRTHTGERPYHCGMCDKTFSRDHHLKKHMETHNVMMFPDKLDLDTLIRQSTPKPSSTETSALVSQSSHSLPGLFLDSSSDNIASRLMESMVKKHLQDGIHRNQSHSNSDHGNQSHDHQHRERNSQSHDKQNRSSQRHADSPVIRERLSDKPREKPLEKLKAKPSHKTIDTETTLQSDHKKGNKLTKSRPLNITDILDDNFIPSSSQISGKLILHHMFNDTKSASHGSSPSEQQFASKQVGFPTSTEQQFASKQVGFPTGTDLEGTLRNSPSEQNLQSSLLLKIQEHYLKRPVETIMNTNELDRTIPSETTTGRTHRDLDRTIPSETRSTTGRKHRDMESTAKDIDGVIDYSKNVKKSTKQCRNTPTPDQSRDTPTFDDSKIQHNKERANDTFTFVDIVDQQLRKEFRSIETGDGSNETEVEVAIRNFRRIESGGKSRRVKEHVVIDELRNIEQGMNADDEMAINMLKNEESTANAEEINKEASIDNFRYSDDEKKGTNITERAAIDKIKNIDAKLVDVKVTGERSNVEASEVAVDKAKDNALTLEDIVNQRLMEEYCIGDI